MTRYFVVFLVRGTEPADQAARAQLTQQHIAYIRQLIEARRYIFAGPFLDGGRVLGMAIAAARSEEEAREWASADPAVKSGEATVELHPAMFPSLEGVKVDYPPKPNP